MGNLLTYSADRSQVPPLRRRISRHRHGVRAVDASVPDFSGIWTRFSYEFDRPLSGPGPVMRRRPTDRIVGDYTNPILKPEAAEAVKMARSS
jgi:hypothetical protein